METQNIETYLEYIISRFKVIGQKDVFIGVFNFDDKKLGKNAKESYFNLSNSSFEEIVKIINESNKDNYSVCLNLNPLNKRSRMSSSVIRILQVFIDLDYAKEEDLETIKSFLEINGFIITYIGKTKSGFHITLDINLRVNEQIKVKEFITYLKYSICEKVDSSVHDISRVMRVPESTHYKEEPFKLKTLYFNINEKASKINSEKIRKFRFSEKKIISSENNFIKIINKDKAISDLYYNKTDQLSKKLFKEGSEILDRSNAEQSLIDKLVMTGITSFESINIIMNQCKIGRWQESTNSYKRSTFSKALENYTRKKNSSQEKETDVFQLLEEENLEFKSLGSGIHNGRFYYTTSRNNGGESKIDILITSKKEIFTATRLKRTTKNDQIKTKFKLNYKDEFYDDVIDNLWSGKSITNYLKDKYDEISLKKLFDEIVKLNERFVFHKNKSVHKYVACDIIATYFLPIFEARGRTLFTGDYGSGKTQQSKMYQLLAHNPVMSGKITTATFDRIVESVGGCIIIDNLDNLGEDEKKPLLQFLQVNYKKGMKGIKADPKTFRPRGFKGFSSIVINNLEGLDKVTLSRCINIRMIKASRDEISKEQFTSITKVSRNIRNNLHIYALDNWEIVLKGYENISIPELTGRDYEISAPILSIAKLINDELFREMVFFLKNTIRNQNQNSHFNDYEFIIYVAINELFGNDKFKKIFPSDIVSKINSLGLMDENYPGDFSKVIGRKINLYKDYFKRSYNNGRVNYIVTRKDFDELLKRRNYFEAVREFKSNLSVQSVLSEEGSDKPCSLKDISLSHKGEELTLNNNKDTKNTNNTSSCEILEDNNLDEGHKKSELVGKVDTDQDKEIDDLK